MSLIRVKQIEPTELFNFVEAVFSGDVGTLQDDVSYLMTYASGISGYADTLSGKIDILSGLTIDLNDTVTGFGQNLDIVSGLVTDLQVYTDDLSGYIDAVSGIASSFSGLAQTAYDTSLETQSALLQTGVIIDILSGRIDTISGNLSTLSSRVDSLSGSYTGFTGSLSITGQQLLARQAGTGIPSGVNVGTGLIIANGQMRTRSSAPVYYKIFQSSATGSITGQIPFDNTIPQSGEGVEIFSQSYTPVYPTSIITAEFNLYVSTSTAGSLGVTAAMFVDSTANALSASFTTVGQNLASQLYVASIYTNANSAAKTFKVNLGVSAAGTIFYNRYSTTGLYGGVSYMTLKIVETPT